MKTAMKGKWIAHKRRTRHDPFTPSTTNPGEWQVRARERLETAGLAVRYHEDPVGHTITTGGVAQARAVLTEALA